MLPAILAVEIEGFAKKNEKVFYKLKKETKLKELLGSPYFFELENLRGDKTAVTADENIFRLYRVK